MGIGATQPFLRIRFTLTVSRSLPIPFDTLAIIQEHRQSVSPDLSAVAYRSMYFAEGDQSDMSKMISGSLGAFHLVASKMDMVAREDVRGVGCMLYGGTKSSQVIYFV
jgi:hypothetical protein